MLIRPATLAGAMTLLASLYVFHLGTAINRYDPRENRDAFIAAIWTHISFALLLLLPIGLYAILRMRQPKPPQDRPGLKRCFRLLVVCFMLKMITGVLAVWTRGSPLKLFDWIILPSPLPRMDRPHTIIEYLHALLNIPFLLCAILFSLVCVWTIFWEMYGPQKPHDTISNDDG